MCSCVIFELKTSNSGQQAVFHDKPFAAPPKEVEAARTEELAVADNALRREIGHARPDSDTCLKSAVSEVQSVRPWRDIDKRLVISSVPRFFSPSL